ncbi:MAG: flavin reductase family protein [Methanomicrobiaceae archaeon]|nr:flavin reductase family protein [Methanomicrobiaceae archaeon]
MKTSLGSRTLLYPHPMLIIGTYDTGGRPDAMAAAWGGICSSDPPCVAFSVQKSRYTCTNLNETAACTVNIPSSAHVAEADYFGLVSGRDTDKFEVCGLTPSPAPHVHAPAIEEFPVVLCCRVINTVEIGVHVQFIAEILDVLVDEAVMAEDGKPDIEKISPLIYDSLRREYRTVGGYVGKAFSAGLVFKK